MPRSKPGVLLFAIAAQGNLCWWCDMPMERPTREHLTPRHKGGRNNRSNIVAVCFGCNHNRGEHEEPTAVYLQMRRVTYLRAIGLYAEMPWRNQIGDGRAAEIPNFGYSPDGERLWAPQYGLIFGPPDASRSKIYRMCRERGVAQW